MNDSEIINRLIELTKQNKINWNEELDGRAFRSKYKGVEFYIQQGWLSIDDGFLNIKVDLINDLFNLVYQKVGIIQKVKREQIHKDRIHRIESALYD